jgi:transposase InsO family protein
MIAFIDDHRGVHGVEPICEVLPIAPSTYHAHAAQRIDPTRCSARTRRDGALMPLIVRVFDENFGVYGVRKVWRQLLREGQQVARCTVARLMKSLGLQGVIRGRPVVPRSATGRPLVRWTTSIGNSWRRGPMRFGCRISPMSRPGLASSTWPS